MPGKMMSNWQALFPQKEFLFLYEERPNSHNSKCEGRILIPTNLHVLNDFHGGHTI